MNSMVLAAHIIFSTYGFWLPNDPRGSWSDFVASWELLRFGKATRVETHRSVAHVPHDRELRRAAKESMKYPAVRFTGVQAQAVGRGFAGAVVEGSYVVHACCILPDHVHLVIASHDRSFEHITRHLKGRASQSLRESGLHPLDQFADPEGRVPSCWSGGLWKVYADTDEEVLRMIDYVDRNPGKEGKPQQQWSFVTKFAY